MLFCYLSKLDNTAEDKQTFKKESMQLLIILIIFDCSFIIRAVYDGIYPQFKKHDWPVTIAVVTLTFYVVCDFVPISCILFYHSRNFKIISLIASEDHQIPKGTKSSKSSGDLRTTYIQLDAIHSTDEAMISFEHTDDTGPSFLAHKQMST